MSDALQLLLNLDQDAIRATSELRWEPATAVLTVASAWWVKGPLLVAAGLVCGPAQPPPVPARGARGDAELRRRRRR